MKKQSTFSLMFRMMLRSIKQNVLQFLAIIAIGAIAITLFVGLISNADVFESQVNSVYSQGNLANLWVTTAIDKVDTKDLAAIEGMLEDGEKVEGRSYITSSAGNNSIYLCVVHGMPTISKPYGELETSEENTSEDFLYVDYDLKKKDDKATSLYSLGDDFAFSFDISQFYGNANVALFDSYVKEGGKNIFRADKVTFKGKVTGFMNHPENITRAAYNASVVVMSDNMFKNALLQVVQDNFEEDATEMLMNVISVYLGFNSLDDTWYTNPNQFVITTNPGRDIDALKKQISDYFEAKGKDNNLFLITRRENMPFYTALNDDVKQARQFTFVFPLVFFLVAILVILTTISQLVLKDRTQIGTLKAIGVSRTQIIFNYILLTVALVFTGTMIGEIIGPLIIPGILGQKYLILYSLPAANYQFPILNGILAAIVFALGASVVTYLVCRRETSLKPSESMRPPVSNLKTKAPLKDKKVTPQFFSLKMAMRNIRMNIYKSLMTVIGVLGCTALLVCGFGIENTITYGIDHDMAAFRSDDISLTFNNVKYRENLESDFDNIDGIDFEHCDLTITTSTTLYLTDGPQMESHFYLIPDNNTYLNVDVDINKVAISEKVSKQTGAKVGDKINFTFNSKKLSCEVGTVFEAFFYNGIVIHEGNECLKDLGTLGYLSAAVKVKEGYDINKVKTELEQFTYVSSAVTQEDWKANIQDVMSGILVMTNAIKIFAILLGIVVLYNLTLMNFKQKNRDIATLKVLGFTGKETMRSLLIESLTLTFVGVAIGMSLGYPFMLAVMETNIVALVHYIYTIYPLTFVYAFLLTYVLDFVINLLLSYRIKRVKMIESLKSVE